MAIIAKFSNGFADKYNGVRPVKAAWMVVLPSGRTLSGHSLSRANAAATARSNASVRSGVDAPLVRRGFGCTAYTVKRAHDLGFKSVRAWVAAATAERAAFVAKCQIEAIDL